MVEPGSEFENQSHNEKRHQSEKSKRPQKNEDQRENEKLEDQIVKDEVLIKNLYEKLKLLKNKSLYLQLLFEGVTSRLSSKFEINTVAEKERENEMSKFSKDVPQNKYSDYGDPYPAKLAYFFREVAFVKPNQLRLRGEFVCIPELRQYIEEIKDKKGWVIEYKIGDFEKYNAQKQEMKGKGMRFR